MPVIHPSFASRPRPRCLLWGLPPYARPIAPRRGALQKRRNDSGWSSAGSAGLRTRIIRESAPHSGAATRAGRPGRPRSQGLHRHAAQRRGYRRGNRVPTGGRTAPAAVCATGKRAAQRRGYRRGNRVPTGGRTAPAAVCAMGKRAAQRRGYTARAAGTAALPGGCAGAPHSGADTEEGMSPAEAQRLLFALELGYWILVLDIGYSPIKTRIHEPSLSATPSVISVTSVANLSPISPLP